MTGQIDFSHAAATAALTLPAALPIAAIAGTTENIVFVGGTLYLSVPPAIQGYVGGASWVYVSLPSTINSAIDTLGTTLAQWCGSTQSLVRFLGSHGVSVSPLGSTSVAGVTANGKELQTTGRRVRRLSKVARRVDSYLPPIARGAPVTFDAWTNPDGQLVQLTADLGSFDVVLNLRDIDQPLSITAPVGAVALPAPALGMLGGFFSSRR